MFSKEELEFIDSILWGEMYTFVKHNAVRSEEAQLLKVILEKLEKELQK